MSSVICDYIYFRELFFNNFPFVYAYSNSSNTLSEGKVDFSVMFCTVTNFRKPCQSNVISLGICAPHLGTDVPLIFQLTSLAFVHTSKCILHFHWYVNEGRKNCHLSAKMYFISPCYVLKNLSKWHTFNPAPARPTVSTYPGFSGTKANRNYRNSGPSKVKRSLHGEVLIVCQSSRSGNKKPKVWRIISRKWFTFWTRVMPIKIMTVTAVKNVRNTTV